MHLTATPVKSAPTARIWKSKPATPAASVYAIEEINAYIVIRDELLAEAEQIQTRAKLASLAIANDFVAGCLQPARGPYHEQCLPEEVALRERKRCTAITNRVAELRASAA